MVWKIVKRILYMEMSFMPWTNNNDFYPCTNLHLHFEDFLGDPLHPLVSSTWHTPKDAVVHLCFILTKLKTEVQNLHSNSSQKSTTRQWQQTVIYDCNAIIHKFASRWVRQWNMSTTKLKCRTSFISARCYAHRGLCCRKMSVCLSVTRRYSMKTTKHVIKRFS